MNEIAFSVPLPPFSIDVHASRHFTCQLFGCGCYDSAFISNFLKHKGSLNRKPIRHKLRTASGGMVSGIQNETWNQNKLLDRHIRGQLRTRMSAEGQ